MASKVIALLDKTQRQAEFFFGPLNIYSFLHTKYATCLRRMGNFEEGGKSQVDKAEECILQAINILDELKLEPLYAQGYYYLGELYAHMGQKDKALETLKKAERMFREMGMDYWLAKTQDVLEALNDGTRELAKKD